MPMKRFASFLLILLVSTLLTGPAAVAVEPEILTGSMAVRSTTYGVVIAVETAEGESHNFFFRSSIPMEPLAHREERGLLVASPHALRLVLPNAKRALHLVLPEAPDGEGSAPALRSLRGAEDTVRYALEVHGIERKVPLTEGFEIRAYAPALAGLAHDELLTHTEAEFRTTLDALAGPEGRRIGDMDALFNDTPDQPGGGGCTSSTSSTCSIDCQGGSSCSITCTNGRCGNCTCDKDVPTCTCA